MGGTNAILNDGHDPVYYLISVLADLICSSKFKINDLNVEHTGLLLQLKLEEKQTLEKLAKGASPLVWYTSVWLVPNMQNCVTGLIRESDSGLH